LEKLKREDHMPDLDRIGKMHIRIVLKILSDTLPQDRGQRRTFLKMAMNFLLIKGLRSPSGFD